jgi:TolA-binding protein
LDQFEDDVEIAPETMYWCGNSHFLNEDLVDAYKIWKRLTWDFPKTQWARFARARLSDPTMQDAAKALEQ